MTNKKKTAVLFVLCAIVLIGTANTAAPEGKDRNLKVLPHDISDKKLDSLMQTYTKALKVSCDFCHTPEKNLLTITPADHNLDYALDNEMKEQARKMIRLTIDINKRYFNSDTANIRPDYLLNVVTCNTCHRGNPFPAWE